MPYTSPSGPPTDARPSTDGDLTFDRWRDPKPDVIVGLMATLEVLHDEIDRAIAPLDVRHADRMECKKGCSDCCADDITVFDVEAELIRARYADLLASGHPHPPGACAFLDKAGACRVYAARPYVCRTQGLPLRWIGEDENDDPVELRDICPLNDAESLEALAEDDCWTLGPTEGRLATIQAAASGGFDDLPRVTLRSLFSAARSRP